MLNCKLTVEQLHYALAACLSEGSLLMLELAETCVATFPPQREKYYLGIREYILMWWRRECSCINKMASNEISSEEAEEKEYVTSAKNQYLAACIVSGLASLSIGTFLLYTVSPSCFKFDEV